MKWLDRFIQRWRIRKVRPYIRNAASVLDIGAADGALAREFPWIGRYVGVDPDASPRQAENAKVRLIRGVFPEAVSSEAPFDVVTLLAVIEHLDPREQRRVVEHSTRFLVDGGYLVITVPSARADAVLSILRSLRLIDGMSLEQHYGFDANRVGELFLSNPELQLVIRRKFQLGFNNLYVFQRSPGKGTDGTMPRGNSATTS